MDARGAVQRVLFKKCPDLIGLVQPFGVGPLVSFAQDGIQNQRRPLGTGSVAGARHPGFGVGSGIRVREGRRGWTDIQFGPYVQIGDKGGSRSDILGAKGHEQRNRTFERAGGIGMSRNRRDRDENIRIAAPGDETDHPALGLAFKRRAAPEGPMDEKNQGRFADSRRHMDDAISQFSGNLHAQGYFVRKYGSGEKQDRGYVQMPKSIHGDSY